MPRELTNIDPSNKSVTFTQGPRTWTVYLDSWPGTDAEIESQAAALLPAYTGDDPALFEAMDPVDAEEI